MSKSRVLLTDEDRALLFKVSSLLGEILETFDIVEDEDAMKSIREAEEDVKAGRVRGYNEFIKELRKSSPLKTETAAHTPKPGPRHLPSAVH